MAKKIKSTRHELVKEFIPTKNLIKELDENDIKRIKDTVYCIEGSHYNFWVQYHHTTDIVQDNMGRGYTIGRMGGLPVCISLTWATVNGQRVMFYESHSALTYYFAIENFLKDVFEKYNDEKVFRTTNESNFHQAVHHIERICERADHHERVKFDTIMREYDWSGKLYKAFLVDQNGFKNEIDKIILKMELKEVVSNLSQ